MSPDKASGAAIAAGQIASAVIGFALGIVVTLLAIVDWPAPAATGRPPVLAAAPQPAPPPAAPQPAPAAPEPAAPAPVVATPAPPPATPAPTPAPAPAPPPLAPTPPPAAAPAEAAPPPASAPAAAKPAPAKPAAPPRPKPREPSPDRPRYVVQAGSFVSAEIAAKVADRLSDHDHPAEVLERTDDSGRTWHVVRLTEQFPTHGEADKVSLSLRREEEVDTLVVRLAPAAKPGAAP